jgi:hypothetical protein
MSATGHPAAILDTSVTVLSSGSASESDLVCHRPCSIACRFFSFGGLDPEETLPGTCNDKQVRVQPDGVVCGQAALEAQVSEAIKATQDTCAYAAVVDH